MKNEKTCAECPFYTNGQELHVVEGNTDAEVAIVLEAPVISEVRVNQVCISDANKQLLQIAKKEGYGRHNCYITYAIKCYHPREKGTVLMKAMKACRESLLEELKQLPNLKYIVTCGAFSIKALLGNVQLMKHVNLPCEFVIDETTERTVTVIPTLHPTVTKINPNKLKDISKTFSILATLQSGTSKIQKPEITEVTEENEKQVMEILMKASLVGCDTETTGAMHKGGLMIYAPSFHMLTTAFAVGNKAFWVDVQKHKKIATLLAVQPPGKFGIIDVDDNCQIHRFSEKPKGDKNWINGGYFILNPEVFDYINDGDQTIWERAPLEGLTRDNQLMAYNHNGFWKCLDTLRDKRELEELWSTGSAP